MNDIVVASFKGHRYIFGPFDNETDLNKHTDRLENAWRDVFIEVYPLNPAGEPLGLSETNG